MIPYKTGAPPEARAWAELYEQVSRVGDFRRGSLNQVRRKCGRPDYACAQPGHPGNGPGADAIIALRWREASSPWGAICSKLRNQAGVA